MSSKRKPTGGVFIAVDETGNNPGEEYAIVATVTKDRKAFRNIIEDRNRSMEMKYSDNKKKAPPIIEQANEVIEGVYVVHTPRPSTKDYEETHIKMLEQINSMIPYDKDQGLLVMVDSEESIDEEKIKDVFKKGKRRGNYTACVVVPSNYFAEIQTNDFITGAVGSHFNGEGEEKTYIDSIKKIKIEPLKQENRRSGSTSVMEAALPTTAMKVHLRNGSGTQPRYGIHKQGRIKRLCVSRAKNNDKRDDTKKKGKR